MLAPALVPVTVGRLSRLGKAKGSETGVIPPSIPKFSGRFGAPGPSRLALDEDTWAQRNTATRSGTGIIKLPGVNSHITQLSP